MAHKIDVTNQRIKALEDEILEDADVSLIKMINLDALLENPEAHLREVANKFLAKHLKKIQEAGRLGKILAEDLIND